MVNKDLTKENGSVANSIAKKLIWDSPGHPHSIERFVDYDELLEYFLVEVLDPKNCFSTSENKRIFYKDLAQKKTTLKSLKEFIEGIYWAGMAYQE